MSFSADDLSALWLTVKLATTVTIVLLVICTPLAWWLATTASRWRGPISAIVALPLVLPPTVLGFYFLLGMGPHGAIGQLTHALGLGYLPFHFSGLVLASVCYSMPFVVQPIQSAMEAIPKSQLDAAAILGAGPVDRFFSVVLPLAKPGFISPNGTLNCPFLLTRYSPLKQVRFKKMVRAAASTPESFAQSWARTA